MTGKIMFFVILIRNIYSWLIYVVVVGQWGPQREVIEHVVHSIMR